MYLLTLNNSYFLQKVSHPILFQEGDVNQTSIHWTVFFAGNSAIVKQKLRKHVIFVRVPFKILRHGLISEGVLPICPLPQKYVRNHCRSNFHFRLNSDFAHFWGWDQIWKYIHAYTYSEIKPPLILMHVHYGITGCGIFEGGVQN